MQFKPNRMREADHSPPSRAEVKNAWNYTSTLPYVFMVWCLVKHRANFKFTLPFWSYICNGFSLQRYGGRKSYTRG
jgi:hypothetical protein